MQAACASSPLRTSDPFSRDRRRRWLGHYGLSSMSSPRQSLAPPSSQRRPSEVPRQRPKSEAPDQPAVVGSATVAVAPGFRVHVHALCWPTVPGAWQTLSHSWETVRANRQSFGKMPAVTATTGSWVSDCAPRFGEPFRGTPAEESSVAALVMRTPIQICLSIQRIPHASDTDATKAEAIQRHGLSECLALYDHHLRASHRSPCTLLIAPGADAETDRQMSDAFGRAGLRLSDAAWFKAMKLRFWRDSALPLSMELAQIVARAVGEYLREEALPNPIADAVLTKLSSTPDVLKRSFKAKRR